VAEGLKASPRTAKSRLLELEKAGLVEGKQMHAKAPKLWWHIPASDKGEKACN
jgi:DNA-binding Lrp family transcriptional regulator